MGRFRHGKEVCAVVLWFGIASGVEIEIRGSRVCSF